MDCEMMSAPDKYCKVGNKTQTTQQSISTRYSDYMIIVLYIIF